MLFTKRQDYITPVSTSLGATLRQELQRDFHLSRLYIQVDVTTSGAIATATADGLLGLIKRVTLNVTDGANSRNVVDCSGNGLLEYAQQITGGLGRGASIARLKTATGTYRITYPVFFEDPRLADPLASQFLLPLPRYISNPVLTIQMASQSDVDSNVSPTFAVSALNVSIITEKREVVIPNFTTWDWELAEITQNYSASGANQLYELQTPGSYTGFLIRSYVDLATRGNNLITNGEIKLQSLGNVVRRFRPEHVEEENDLSKFGQMVSADNAGNNSPMFSGSYFLDFLTDNVGESAADMGSVFDTNIIATSGARPQLLADVAGGTNVKLSFVAHRVFGDLTNFKLRTRLAAAQAGR